MATILNPFLRTPLLQRWQFSLLLSVVLVLFYNQALWRLMISTVEPSSLDGLLFLGSFFLLLTAMLSLIFNLVASRRLLKILAVALLISSACISFFMHEYGVLIDKSMIRNAFETDTHETLELINSSFLLNLLFKGVIPALLILPIRIQRKPFKRELGASLIYSLSCLLAIGTILITFYKDYALVFRENRQIRYLVTPTNYIYYSLRYLSRHWTTEQKILTKISNDVQVRPGWQIEKNSKPVVSILIVGETARAQNFSLNGYPRNTNPELARLPLINFSDTQACGTSTAISVPCMFSDLPRRDFDVSAARYRENLMDLFSAAGYNTQWRENNSGCKGVCERISVVQQAGFINSPACNDGVCQDEALLYQLDQQPAQLTKNTVIVLHQMGSHGPAYHKRYPARFERFAPVCKRSDVSQCSREEISNGYDNSILYTDWFISQTISLLRQQPELDSNLIYLSDHGESLGENGIYLHGLPWFMAPDTQKQVPMLMWFSDNYRHRFRLSDECLHQRAQTSASHDNLFHSMLGIMGISSLYYQPELDLVSPCMG